MEAMVDGTENSESKEIFKVEVRIFVSECSGLLPLSSRAVILLIPSESVADIRIKIFDILTP